MRCDVVLALLANHIQVLNERKCSVDLSPEEVHNFEVGSSAGNPESVESCICHGIAVPKRLRIEAGISGQLMLCTLVQDFWAHHAAAPLCGRNAIIASVCPQLHGMFAIKLAVLLMLIGGLTRVSETGMHIRGDIHMLLVGDPGTGKPQQTVAVELCCNLAPAHGHVSLLLYGSSHAMLDHGCDLHLQASRSS